MSKFNDSINRTTACRTLFVPNTEETQVIAPVTAAEAFIHFYNNQELLMDQYSSDLTFGSKDQHGPSQSSTPTELEDSVYETYQNKRRRK